MATARDVAEIESCMALNLAGCFLKRVDGESRVDYLAVAEPMRRLARDLFGLLPLDWRATMANTCNVTMHQSKNNFVGWTPRPSAFASN